MLTTIIKQPAEQLHPLLGFATTSPIATIVSAGVAARGLVPGAAALTAEATLAAGAVTVALSGGGDGERYLVTVRVTDTGGQELESELEVAVVDGAWALPDGGAPWLSIADFVKSVGLDEVLRMTDQDGAGRVDRDLLVGALGAAQTTAEAYLAGRYLLPLAAVPAIVALVVTDLARDRLYPNGAPDGVAAKAKAAMATLVAIQSGTLPLPVAGIAPAAAPSPAPVVSVPGRRRYPDGLAGY